MKPFLTLVAAAIALTHFFGQPAEAGIVVDGTRVVYPASMREVVVTLSNKGETPALVQVWIDTGNASSKPTKEEVPFVVTPPIFRLDPSKGQSLRLSYTGDALPRDRESLFWLNVLDIPPRAPKEAETPNRLDFAFKHRLKLFFRPMGMTGSALEAPALVQWKIKQQSGKFVLEVVNPTPYHVSLSEIELVGSGKKISVKNDMLRPLSTSNIDLPNTASTLGSNVQVNYGFVNDYGGVVKGSAKASSTQ